MTKPILSLLLGLALCNVAFAQQGRFDKKIITSGNAKTFTWINWTKAPQPLKEATKLIQTNDPSYPTLFDFIRSVLDGDEQASVDLAIIDLDNDRIAGIGVLASARDWCGTAGCTYELYDNGGMLVVGLNDYDLKPGHKGVKSSAGKFFPLRTNPRSHYKTAAEVPAIFKL